MYTFYDVQVTTHPELLLRARENRQAKFKAISMNRAQTGGKNTKPLKRNIVPNIQKLDHI